MNIAKPVGENGLQANVDASQRLALLTARERQILELVLDGWPSKIIAAELGISRRTGENHRAAVMSKTGSKSIPALVRLALFATWNALPQAATRVSGRSVNRGEPTLTA